MKFNLTKLHGIRPEPVRLPLDKILKSLKKYESLSIKSGIYLND